MNIEKMIKMTIHRIQGVAEECLKGTSVCNVCGYDDTRALCIHHITPVSNGGTDDLENLIVLCANCHQIIHTNNRRDEQPEIRKSEMANLLKRTPIKSADNLNFESFVKTGKPFKKFLEILGCNEHRVNILMTTDYTRPFRREKIALFFVFYLGYIHAQNEYEASTP